MLTELRLENFKCFNSEVALPFGGLSLLTGINGKGKSTVLQALLALHQSIDTAISSSGVLDHIELNGQYVRLGTFREIQNRDRSKIDSVHLKLEFTSEDETISTCDLDVRQEDDARWGDIVRFAVEQAAGGSLDFRGALPLEATDAGTAESPQRVVINTNDELARKSCIAQLARVHYVGADRLGPQDFFSWSSRAGFLSVGARGERTAEVLFQAEREHKVIDSKDPRARGEQESETLLITDQASSWLSYLLDGGAVRALSPHPTILTLEMNSDGGVHYHRPVHLGFGYSYALPIIVAGLIAQPGDMLVVENPEAHLHPLAQSRVGEFLTKVSMANVQVFVESHSEHILNAFRLAVKSEHVEDSNLRVLYFRNDPVDPVLLVPVEKDGRILMWPSGFFDQRTRDFSLLFGDE